MALPPNPKQAYGDKKPNVALVPPALDLYAALALGDGAVKYGPFNWREKSVEVMTYVAAIMRHLGAWVDRQDLSEAEGFIDKDGTSYKLGAKPQLAHVAACVAILVDAVENGNAIDNRPPAGPSLKIQADWHGKLPVGESTQIKPLPSQTSSPWVPDPTDARNEEMIRETAVAKVLDEDKIQPSQRYASEEDRRIGKLAVADKPLRELPGKYEHAMPDLDQEYPPCDCPTSAYCSGENAAPLNAGSGKRVMCVKFRAKDDERFDVV